MFVTIMVNGNEIGYVIREEVHAGEIIPYHGRSYLVRASRVVQSGIEEQVEVTEVNTTEDGLIMH